MNKLIDRQQRDLTRLGLGLGVMLLCIVRLALAAQGRLFLEPENSPIDDQLMYNAAVSITEGNWLGEYAYNTIAKHMFFSVWLAFVHWTGVPYLIANAVLALAGAWVMAAALQPILKKRSWVLGAFLLLAYCPVGFDQYNYRVYRDSITVALLLLAFGGITGCVLRALPVQNETPAVAKRRRTAAWLYAAAGGLGLGTGWLNREDGIWMLPFCVCLVLLGAIAVIRQQGLRKSLQALASFCLPFVLLGGCIAAYAGMNLKYYDRFIVSDLTTKEFTTAYGMLTGIEDEGTGRCRPITYATRKKLYANSDFFAALEPNWEHRIVLNGYGSKETHEYLGSFYYALRLASQFAGQYRDPLETKAYYEAISAELQRLEEQGVIDITHFSRSTVPYWRWEYLIPTVKETGNGLAMSLLCLDFDPGPKLSIYTKDDLVAEMLDYLGGDIVRGYEEGSNRPYYNILQKAAFAGENVLCRLWRILIVPAAAAGLWFCFAYWKRGWRALFGRKKTADPVTFVWVLLWGLLLSVLLRCGMMAYMEIAVFKIGTYLMYQSTAVPLFGLFGLLGAHALCTGLRHKKGPKQA